MLYGTGHLRVDDQTGKPTRVGGIKYVMKDESRHVAFGVLSVGALTYATAEEIAAMKEGMKRGQLFPP